KDMSEIMYCEACQTTDSAKFQSLGGEMWKKAVNNSLVKKDWEEGIRLCNICYMNIKNPLDKLSKQAKNTNIDEDAKNEVAHEKNESYEVSDRHLLRGFVTAKKPSIVTFCDYVHCRNSNYSVD
ncbi:23640_t:CDS:2, partial [Gigaspora margarita]